NHGGHAHRAGRWRRSRARRSGHLRGGLARRPPLADGRAGRGGWRRSPRAARAGARAAARRPALVGVAPAASAIALVSPAETVLDGLVHMLHFPILARLFTAASTRDART